MGPSEERFDGNRRKSNGASNMRQASARTRAPEGSSGLVMARDRLPVAVIGRGGATAARVAMDLVSGEDGFRLSLLDREGATLMKLGPYREEDVVAEWQGLGAAACLPLAILF